MSLLNKIFLALFILIPGLSKGQIGLILGGKINQAPGWVITDLNNNIKIDLVDKAFFGGVDFELEYDAYRLAFVPEFNFAFYQKESIDLGLFSSKMFRFQLNTHIYFLDFKGDCNCPTFSKKGDPIKKGLFATISPGAGYIENNIQGISSNQKNVYISPDLGFGLGYDIGLNERITLTTFVNGYYFPVLKWPGLPYMLSLPSSGNRFANSDTSLQQIHAGITIRYHL